VDCASLALQVAPVSYYCLNFVIGLHPKLGNTYYHFMGRSPNYGRNSNIFHITNGLNSLHQKWYTGNQYMVKSVTRIILRPILALSLDEGLNSPCDKNASASLWKREPISDDYLPSMRKAVLSISGNVYKQQEMEIDKLTNDA
jgi:hypothetical protein